MLKTSRYGHESETEPSTSSTPRMHSERCSDYPIRRLHATKSSCFIKAALELVYLFWDTSNSVDKEAAAGTRLMQKHGLVELATVTAALHSGRMEER